MQTTEAFAGLSCLDCGVDTDPDSRRCPSCGGALAPTYDEDALAAAHEQLFAADGTPARPGEGLARFAPALPFEADALVGLSEGATPLAPCSRAGIEATAAVPSRSSFDTKAMINVHGGEMNVVGGRYPDAVAAFADRGDGAHSLAPFETPYRHEGPKTLAYELAACDPDAVVHPTSHGTGLAGLYRGFRELAATGVIDTPPRLYAAQPAGCAPVTEAWEADRDAVEPVEYPDTIVGALEVPDPAGGSHALAAVTATDGGAVAVADDRLLDAALDAARAGLPVSATGGAAVAAGTALAEQGAFGDSETVVLVDPATANRETDMLRSRLMSEGV